MFSSRKKIQERLQTERGRLSKQAPETIALLYPEKYRVGMSSLGYQWMYRTLMLADCMACERFFVDDDEAGMSRPVSYESGKTLTDFSVIATSVAYELQLAELTRALDASGIPALRSERSPRDPLVIAGGPLTFSNPAPLSALADVIVMGEADSLALQVFSVAMSGDGREQVLDALAAIPHVFVPGRVSTLPPVARCDDALLPAFSTIRSPEAELSDMFLIEAERGCSRGCAYCVMRRSTNGGMRIVPAERVLELVPEDVDRVGLVGAAVSDHPRISHIVRELSARGCEVGLSSLRPDRLNEEFVDALARAGYKTLTTAMDGTSDRVRESLDRKTRRKHLERAAELARAFGMKRLKLYLMVGVPGETDADVDECVELVSALSTQIPIALGVAPFCAKRNTPLDGTPFAGVATVDARLSRLRRGLRGRATVRATSAKWAWVEYVLAQGDESHGRAVVRAVRAGGTYADYRRELLPIVPVPSRGDVLLVPPSRLRKRAIGADPNHERPPF